MTVYEYNTYKLMALYTLFHMSWHGDDDDDHHHHHHNHHCRHQSSKSFIIIHHHHSSLSSSSPSPSSRTWWQKRYDDHDHDDNDDEDDDGDVMMMIIMFESVEQCPGWMELWKLKQVRMPCSKCAIQKMCTPEWFFLEPVIVFGIVCAGNVEACKAWTEHCKLHSPKRH